MEKILDYIKNPQGVLYCFGQTYPFEKLICSDAQEHILIIPNGMVIHTEDFRKVFERYYLSKLYGISNCYLGTSNEPYIFMHITKVMPKEVKIADFCEPAHLCRDDFYNPARGTISVPTTYREEFLRYIEMLDTWSNSDNLPDINNSEGEFRILSSEDVSKEIVIPAYYHSRNDEVRNLLKTEKIQYLGDVAEVLYSKLETSRKPEKVRILEINPMPSYPYIPEKDSKWGFKTNIRIQKNDILSYKGKFFLIDKESDEELYAPCGCYVIRTREISAEYLYIYLTSRIGHKIRTAFTVSWGNDATAQVYALKEFPVVLPKLSNKEYEDIFLKISNPDCRFYERMCVPTTAKNIDDIIKKEYINTIMLQNDELLRKHIKLDLEELNICYKNGAYKASIIMAGAILEAFVIDWMSELNGCNYLKKKEDLYVERDIDGELRTVKADLIDYIDELALRLGPAWSDKYRDDAQQIRKYRNKVHIKKCLSNKEKITEAIVIDVIKKLEFIIDSRMVCK